jgi:DNA (cytosine-5)-methyltransferase 1
VTRGATLFSGGGGCEALLKQRIDFVHAVEYDPAIAAVYHANHPETCLHVASVCDVDYAPWGALDYLHASPVCKEFSQAKTGGVEGENDIQTALAVVRCLEQTTPRVFTLENVGAYQHSKSYKLICRALDLAGYMWHAEVLNSADFAVPQTRRRLILRAVKDALLPGLAAPERWVGWYAAIEDLLPGLPDSAFAPWQLARLPEAITGHTFFNQNESDDGRGGTYGVTARSAIAPSTTIKASVGASWYKAFIVSNAATEYGDGIRAAAEPVHSITAQANGRTRAWLVESKNANQQYGDGMRRDDEPATTVITDHKPSHQPKAWLSAGRVVRMTPRALARFQSLPDSYMLPDKAGLACTVIGNMVPSLMMQKIVEPLL